MLLRVDGGSRVQKFQEIEKKPEVNPDLVPQPANQQGLHNKVYENNFHATNLKADLNNRATAQIIPTDFPADAPITEPANLVQVTPTQALDQIKNLPVPRLNDSAGIREYNQQRGAIADEALANAVPPNREDFAALNGRTAEFEYREAQTHFDSQIRELENISSAAQTAPNELPLDAPLPPHEALARIEALPRPDVSNPASLAEHQRQSQIIAEASIANAQPPRREDFAALPPRLADMEYRDALGAYNSQVAELTPYAEGVSYARYDAAVDYMFNEMKNNLNSEPFQNIQSYLELAANPPFGSSPNATTGYLTAAATEFYNQVKTGGPWDHKPQLQEMLGLEPGVDLRFPVRGDTQNEVFYDIWSNIHYGYIGTAAGFDQSTLQTAADISEHGTGKNDPVDRLTVQIGIDLWNEYGANMTKEQFDQEIQQRLPEIIAAQESPEYREKNSDFQHVSPRSNGY